MQDLTVALIQTALHWEDAEANRALFAEKIAGIAGSTDLIVLPEMFTTGFSMNAAALAEKPGGPATEWLKKTAEEKGCVITGSVITDGSTSLTGRGSVYYNRLLWMRPDGRYDTYDKRHLFRMGSEHNHYAAGKRRLIADLKGWKVCPMICYDLRFPVWTRNAPLDGSPADGPLYDLLLFVANWPEKRRHAWSSLLTARAIENQCYVIGVNRIGADGNGIAHSGDSSVISPLGEVLCAAKAGEPCVETATLSRQVLEELHRTFPVGMDADKFRVTD